MDLYPYTHDNHVPLKWVENCSLYMAILIVLSFFSWSRRSSVCLVIAIKCWICCRLFSAFLTWSCTLHKVSLFQSLSFSFKIFNFLFKTYIGQPTTLLFQHEAIILAQSRCRAHIWWNLNCEANLVSSKWIHCWLHMALSNLFSVKLLPCIPLDQVNKAPLVGKCIKWLDSDHWRNSSIGSLAGWLEPLYSRAPIIEL